MTQNLHKITSALFALFLTISQGPNLQQASNDSQSPSDDGDPFPLHTLVKTGQYKTVKLLVKGGGYDLNLLDDTGKTPLDHATTDSKIYNWLISKGACAASQANNKAHSIHPDFDDHKQMDAGDVASQLSSNSGQAPQAPPVTAEQALKHHYQQWSKIPALLDDAPQSITNCYIHLAMTTQQTYSKNREKALSPTENNNDDRGR